MSLYLLFDIGNTRLKWSAVESQQNPIDRNKKLWLYSGAIDTQLLLSPEHCAELAHYILQTIPKPDAIGICCVAAEECATNLKQLFAQFETAADELEGVECWSARELQFLLGYSKWENFEKVIQKA